MRIACLLLAAGAGSRFGACKQLALVGGKPLLRHSLETLAAVFDDKVYIVLGAHREHIRGVVGDLALVIDHAKWQQGLGSSIAHGIREVEAREHCDGMLVALADQIYLSARDFGLLLDRFDGDRIVAAHYAGQPGVPAIFPSSKFGELGRLNGDRGAKSMLMEMHRDIVTVSLPAAAADIDTVADIRVLTYPRPGIKPQS